MISTDNFCSSHIISVLLKICHSTAEALIFMTRQNYVHTPACSNLRTMTCQSWITFLFDAPCTKAHLKGLVSHHSLVGSISLLLFYRPFYGPAVLFQSHGYLIHPLGLLPHFSWILFEMYWPRYFKHYLSVICHFEIK